MDTLKESGDFEAETNTRSDATGEVLRVIVDEFWRLQRERVGERELDGAKAYLTGSFPLTIETPEAIAMQVVNALFYGLPLQELQNFRERVNAVTPDDIQRVAKALLRPDRLSVVLVGNSAAFASQLKGVGFETFETVELADLDLTSATFKRTTVKAEADRAGWAGGAGWAGRAGGAGLNYQQAPLASRPSDSASPDEIAKAGAMLDKVIAAKGGLDKLRGLKSIVAKQTQSSRRPDGESTVETTNYIEYPNHLRVETEGQVQAYDGTRVWMKDKRGLHDAPEMFAREMAAGLRRDVVALLLAAKDGTLSVRLLPDVKDPEGRVSHALELSATDLNPIVLYIDLESSLILKRLYTADAPGRPVIEEEFHEYRAVDGIQFAFHATQRVGSLSVDRRVTDVKLNSTLDPALFNRPAS